MTGQQERVPQCGFLSNAQVTVRTDLVKAAKTILMTVSGRQDPHPLDSEQLHVRVSEWTQMDTAVHMPALLQTGLR